MKTKSFDTNLIIDPGFRCIKPAIRDGDCFRPVWFPSVVTPWDKNTPGVLDERTVKISVQKSQSEYLDGRSVLVGSKAKASQNIGTLYAYNFEKTDPEIAPWLAIASLSYQIPAGLREVTIEDAWVVFLLFDPRDEQKYKDAIAFSTVATIEREINGKKDTVVLNLRWTQDKMHCLQEGVGALEYVRALGLEELDPEFEYGSVNLGGNTVEYLRQSCDGQVLQRASQSMGVVGLAKLIEQDLAPLVNRGKVSVDNILDAIKEGGRSARYCYGKGNNGVDFSAVFNRCRINWEKKILGTIASEWRENLPYIQKIFMHGGSAPIFMKENPQLFFFQGEHDPQFVDVWGAYFWSQENLFE